MLSALECGWTISLTLNTQEKIVKFIYNQSPYTESITNKHDLFKQPLPHFNIRGRDNVPSLWGVLASVLIMAIVTVYSLSKFIQMMSRHNPNIASWIEHGAIDQDVVINFRDAPMRIAFGIHGYIDHELKDDERYVKIFARLFT